VLNFFRLRASPGQPHQNFAANKVIASRRNASHRQPALQNWPIRSWLNQLAVLPAYIAQIPKTFASRGRRCIANGVVAGLVDAQGRQGCGVGLAVADQVALSPKGLKHRQRNQRGQSTEPRRIRAAVDELSARADGTQHGSSLAAR
jgi:hypothetical protein